MKAIKFLFSGLFMGILLVVFAIAIGYATFIENDFDAATAKMLIYNAHWFEVLLLLMAINFSGMIFTRQLYRKSKLNILVIHLALIIIIAGAAITRYVGFEGQMHIRQGQTTDRYLSADTYVEVQLNGDEKTNLSKRIWLSPINEELFNETLTNGDKIYQISISHYMPNATISLSPNDSGEPLISLVAAGSQGRKDFILHQGETTNPAGLPISFDESADGQGIQFVVKNGQLSMKSPIEYTEQNMMDRAAGDTTMTPGVFHPASPMHLYKFADMSMMIRSFVPSGEVTYKTATKPNQPGERVATLTVSHDGTSSTSFVKWGDWNQQEIDGVNVACKFGYQAWVLPFSLQLNAFQLERYPGSMSPSSFASEITLIDRDNNVKRPFRIFMNNILEYKGYRFYQSSYDQDEKGTILSVNHDYWGTLVTYTGYALLFASLILSLFTKKTRFRKISQQLQEIHEKRKKLLISMISLLIVFAGSTVGLAQNARPIDQNHAKAFGRLLAQSKDGRIVPVNTLSTQVLVKIYKKSSFEGLTGDQVFLGMIANAQYWQAQRMIKIGDDQLKRVLGISGKYASFNDFFDQNGQYKLRAQIDAAYAKKPVLRNMYDKELIYADERVNVAYMVYSGSFLKMFPIPNHSNNKWATIQDFTKKDQNLKPAFDLFSAYLDALTQASKTGNYGEADKALKQISDYQQKEGAAIMPPASRINLEILYNQINIFKTLFPIYMMMGMILFGFFFLQIFKPHLRFAVITKVLVGILVIAFVTQTIGLAIRWYISGHAPWSNGYESMIYISWATMLAGFIFMKKSPIVLSITSLLTGVTLLTAHMSWMNPEITNLVPVLKSYWLTIHVATITASYGFLALGSITGFVNLCIMIFRNQKNLERVNLTLRELSLIIEMALSVGLVLLTIGNFLGGVWANESWGRYWGWDPKETWALVTIIVYAFILHMRLIPRFRNVFTFNFLAMFGFSTVLMTYFGVNYYLSGLHSYAAGDPVPVPTFVYYTLAAMILVSALAAYNEYTVNSQTEEIEE